MPTTAPDGSFSPDAETQPMPSIPQVLQPSEERVVLLTVQDRTWVDGADRDWEFYTVLADAPAMTRSPSDPCRGLADRVGRSDERRRMAAAVDSPPSWPVSR